MSIADHPPELLKQAVFELIAQCRRDLAQGKVDASEVARGVEAYCRTIAALPVEEGRRYADDLHELMREMGALGVEFATARDAVLREIGALGRFKSANVAYQKSDAIGDKRPRDESEPS